MTRFHRANADPAVSPLPSRHCVTQRITGRRARRSAMRSSLVGVAVALAAGCSGSPHMGAGMGGMSGNLLSECVDAIGPNSTPEQLVDAALAAEVTNPLTGQPITVSQQLAQDKIPVTEKFHRDLVESIFTDVPAGGDAAFASAACQVPGWDIRNGSFVYMFGPIPSNAADHDRVAKTPHLLRGFGRQQCSGRSGDPKRWDQEEHALKTTIDEARADPEAYKRSQLAETDEYIANGGKFLATSPLAADPVFLAIVKDSRERLNAEPAQETVKRLEAAFAISQQLPFEHQCPQFRHGVPTLGREKPFEWAEGFGGAQPESISLASTASSSVSDITWQSWGQPRAIGHGVTFHGVDEPKSEIFVIAFDLGDCDGHPAYRKVVRTSDPDEFDPGDATDVCPE